MQRGALHLLPPAKILLGEALCANHAGDGRGLRQALLLHQQFQRAIATPAGGMSRSSPCLGAVGIENRAGTLRLCNSVRRAMSSASSSIETPVVIVPDVRLRKHEPVEGNLARRAEGQISGLPWSGSPGRLAERTSLSPSFRHRSPALLSLSPRGIACISEATRSGRRGWRLRVLSLKDVIRRLRGRARGARDRAIVFSNDLEPGSDIVGVTNGRGDAK